MGIFNQPLLEGVLPNNLHTLMIDNEYTQAISTKIFPENLHTLYIGKIFNTIIKKILPPKLHTLDLGINYFKSINEEILPDSLQMIYLPSSSIKKYTKLTQKIFQSVPFNFPRLPPY